MEDGREGAGLLVDKTSRDPMTMTRGWTTVQWRWRVLQLAGVLVLAAAALTIFLSPAGATGPPNGSTIPNAAVPTGIFTASTPFSSGQQVNVEVPANSLLPLTANVNILECSAPGGVVPTDPLECDGSTIQGVTLKPESNGSIDLQAEKNTLYTLYALPDLASLGETSGPECDLTTECVLYIGTEQSDFTQPHYWSQPFFINPNAGVDNGQNPGDGSAPPAPSEPSATISTVSATSPSAAADDEDPDSVAVTLLGTGNVPVPGKAVSLSQGAGHSTVAPSPPATVVTNASGVATFTVTDSTAESVTYSATDATDSIPITQTASVNFQTPTVSAAHSSVAAAPPAVPADGATTSTVTVTLRDQAADPQPLAGRTVTLSQGSGHSSPIPAAPGSDVTNAQGVATFTVIDTTPELVTYGARDTTDGVTLTATTQVTFGTLTVSGTTSTVSAPSPAPVGGPAVSVTVTLLTSNSDPVVGKTVTLAASSGSVAITPSATPDVTGANGQATFSVSDTAAESVTFTATDATDADLVLTHTAVVAFAAPAPSATGPADGTTPVTISVVIRDQFTNPLAGKTVLLAANPPGSVAVVPTASGNATPGVTNASGTAQFSVLDTTAESVTFTATDTTDAVHVNGSANVVFTAGSPDANQSTVTSNPTSAPSDGKTTSTVTVTLNDHFGNPISGKTISLQATNGSSSITAVDDTTDTNGAATFTVDDADQEVVGYIATDTTDLLQLNAEAVVTFGNPAIPPPVPADCAMVASPQSVAADGTTSATVTVLLYDAEGNPVPAQSVTLAPSGGSSVVTALSGASGAERERSLTVTGTSASNGQATFAVTDTTAEQVTYTATDTTDSLALTGQSVTISFTQPLASTTTTTTTATTTATTPTTSGTGTTSTTSTVTPAAAAPASTGGNSASGGSVSDSSGFGGSASTGSSGASLAFTGAPTLLPWLLGLGAFLLFLGTLGRRLLIWRSR